MAEPQDPTPSSSTDANAVAPSTVTIRAPSKYVATPPREAEGEDDYSAAAAAPPLDWLHRTWTVTHSTLGMWRSAQNVRITYSPLSPVRGGPSGQFTPRLGDLVEYESNRPGKKPAGVKTVEGVDTASGPRAHAGAWDWRGRRWLRFVHSHWEVLGWGRRPLRREGAEGAGEEEELWVVTWFAPTLFTKEGVDFYSSRREGLSEATAAEIRQALEAGPKPLADMVKADLRPVDIKLPWQQR